MTVHEHKPSDNLNEDSIVYKLLDTLQTNLILSTFLSCHSFKIATCILQSIESTFSEPFVFSQSLGLDYQKQTYLIDV